MAWQQYQVLNTLDVAKTQWYHFTAVVIAGIRFFTDAYDLFCIILVTKLVSRIYFHKDALNIAKTQCRIYFHKDCSYTLGSLPDNVSATINGVALRGTLAIQLFFGWLGDKMGLKLAYGMTLMHVVISSIASGYSFGKDPKALMAILCFFRFWLGFDIGGDYPLSTTIMSECTNKKTRGAFIADVFTMQGFRILASGMVAIIAFATFNAKFQAQFMRLIAFDQLCLKLIIFGV
ncbi:hypothetical protein JRO89_XS11G0072400 [Xanthoceras sorbifolium]|uniref:Major facilitator superfamily (MFS) profile domain-containing protein n=1 Tax=Xanthoceras sorbifolium TaxID=99658 RepID=A0ABQ8HEZ7_9ROSI|nr:hypothetical protein JRO89_XS11G0072400 [Xanthoceras sorbifolium]